MTEPRVVYLTRNVFVAGRPPDVTYNPRSDRQQETEVRAYIGQPGKALSVSGPTKSGKTVLIERILPPAEAIWMQGSDLTSADVFWARIIDWLGLYDALEVSTQVATQSGRRNAVTVGVPKVVSYTGEQTDGGGSTASIKKGRRRNPADVAREGLTTLPVPIVVDDFHYVPDDVKRDIARAIKSVLPITHVIMIAVPHEAFEAVRREPDMTGRVWNLEIERWSVEELKYIARKGFEVLDIDDPDERVGARLAEYSYGAPFLMQQLCYDLATANGVLETGPRAVSLDAPDGDWEAFLQRIAKRSVPDVFQKLLKGPNPRGQQRIERVLSGGVRTDIYGAVLHAIALTGPKTTIRQQEIVQILESELVDAAPKGQNVSSALGHMAHIAEESRGTGDAALAFKDEVVHLLDPFLAFFLRWGTWLK